MTHLRTNKVAEPTFPYEAKTNTDGRRAQLATWMTSADNRYFASSYVNRLWGYLLGAGIIEPLDDIRAGNPPTNPELLEHLTKEFIESGFNVRHVLTLIAKSRTYQLALATNRWNEDDKTNYSHALARRLPAEVLYDAVLQSPVPAPSSPAACAPRCSRTRRAICPAASSPTSDVPRGRVPASANAAAICASVRSWLCSAARP
jgi:hypothetical protein